MSPTLVMWLSNGIFDHLVLAVFIEHLLSAKHLTSAASWNPHRSQPRRGSNSRFTEGDAEARGVIQKLALGDLAGKWLGDQACLVPFTSGQQTDLRAISEFSAAHEPSMLFIF